MSPWEAARPCPAAAVAADAVTNIVAALAADAKETVVEGVPASAAANATSAALDAAGGEAEGRKDSEAVQPEGGGESGAWSVGASFINASLYIPSITPPSKASSEAKL